MAAYCGFPEAEYDSVFIILDKMDKIGMDGVTAELLEAGYDRKSVDMCKELFETVTNDIAGVNYLKEKLGDCLEAGTAEDLETIISTVEETKSADFKIAFDESDHIISDFHFLCKISFIPVTGFFFNAITHYLQLSFFLLIISSILPM